MFDVVIVGGGMGGLAAGALLSRRGYKTLLLEENAILGGRANSVEYKSGYTVDWGLHLLRFGDKGVAAQVFKMLGEQLEVMEVGEGKLFHQDQWFELPTKADVLARTPLLNSEDRKSVGGLMAKIIGTPPQKVLDVSVSDWLNDIGSSDTIKMIMRLISKLCITTNAPDDLSCGEVFTVISGALKAGKSVGYPKGGWKTIIDRLSSAISNEAGDCRIKAKVEKIEVDEKKNVRGVVVKGRKIGAATVIYCAPCQQLHSLLRSEDVGDTFLERARKIIPTAGVAIDFGLKGKVSDLTGMVAVNEPFILGQFTSNIDPSVAPSGEQLASFLYLMPSREIQDKRMVEQGYATLLGHVFKMFPKLRESILWERKVTMPIVDGVLPTPLQSREKRIGFTSPVRGLYFAGDCYDGEGGGSDIAFHSAKRCAEVIESGRGI